MSNIDNLRIRRGRPLIAPAILAEDIPLTAASEAFISTQRTTIADIVNGLDPRLLVVVGPCSVHDPVAVLEYGQRLTELREQVSENLFIVMRVYFEKPRTTVGWKGFINDPYLDESFKVNDGLRQARALLADLTELKLPCATEFLDTTFGQYFSDLISWGAIGARTVESQVHRQLASGLSMPVGIKNSTSGNVSVAVDALLAAKSSHLFPSLTKEGAPALLETTGNPDCHLILRGGVKPNFSAADVSQAADELSERGINTGIVVDCSHGNSSKDPNRQPFVAKEVVAQRQQGQNKLIGIMIESHLQSGRQNQAETYGQSITDACLGWADTAKLLTALNSP
ncbi:MAG: 3-deoxy-7-phosphoheptulonate synthase [Pseudomonadaceae bacterium]|nr:3-deoxy-7-phosphoheptulonate synthase [Pseudomonadaceae bacterium]